MHLPTRNFASSSRDLSNYTDKGDNLLVSSGSPAEKYKFKYIVAGILVITKIEVLSSPARN